MQSFLDVCRRPVVVFDPTNVEHRKHMSQFLKEGTWGKCPVAFYAPDNMSIKAYAMETLIDFYLKKEFVVSKRRASIKTGKLIAIKHSV
jgi:hypothetical protein